MSDQSQYQKRRELETIYNGLERGQKRMLFELLLEDWAETLPQRGTRPGHSYKEVRTKERCQLENSMRYSQPCASQLRLLESRHRREHRTGPWQIPFPTYKQ